MKTNYTDFPLMETKNKSYPLFYPYVSKKSIKSVPNVLKTRWIGQGPLVDKFEEIFKGHIGGLTTYFVTLKGDSI